MKKKIDGRYLDGDESVAGWQTIYCSLSLIMVVLFIMLVSYSVADRGKMNDLRGTLVGYGTNTGKIKISKMNAGLIKHATLNGGAWVDSAMHSLNRVGTIFESKKNVAVERFHGGMRCKFNSDVIFSTGSAMINEKIYPYLDEMSKIAKEHNLSVRVEGHTDNVPIRSIEFPSNWELSTARSTNVIRYFITKCGFPAKRLSAEGFAQYRPLAPNSSPEGREQNRRIEVYLERDRDETSPNDQNNESKSK
jgi:chemotaxis protein MotB